MINNIIDKQIQNNKLHHSYLITASEKLARELIINIINKLNISQSDIYILDHVGRIKIQDIRQLQQRISLKPYDSKYKIAYLPNSEDLTAESSNALLKTLEEPPFHSIIFLHIEKADSLLATIKSRCQTITINSPVVFDDNDLRLIHGEIEKIKKLNVKEKFSYADMILAQEDDSIINKLTSWQYFLKRNNKINQFNLLKKIMKYSIILKTQNVNKKLLIENLLLNIKN